MVKSEAEKSLVWGRSKTRRGKGEIRIDRFRISLRMDRTTSAELVQSSGCLKESLPCRCMSALRRAEECLRTGDRPTLLLTCFTSFSVDLSICLIKERWDESTCTRSSNCAVAH